MTPVDCPSPRDVQLVVPPGTPPERLDRYVTAQDLQISRSKVQKLIDSGDITVNGNAAPARYTVRAGDIISITLSPPEATSIGGEDIPLDIIFEDEYLAIVNKPAGMVTHPAPGNYSGTLVNALIHRFGTLAKGGGADRPGIVHRLDKNTTGLLVVAKDDITHRALQDAIVVRTVHRSYLALVCGHVAENAGTIDKAVGRSPSDRKKMTVVSAGGREATTHYLLKERFRSYDLLDVALGTGRTHQIRVHFASIGHPVFGDPEYGGREKWHRGIFAPERLFARRLLALIARQALHAQSLEFTHPHTQAQLKFTAPIPGDFQSVLDLLSREGQ